MVFFLSSSSSLRWKKGRGIYTPSQNVAVADLEGRIIRPKLGRIIRPLAGLSAPPIWVTPRQVLSRISAAPGGGRIIRPKLGRIIRPLAGISGPPIWVTPRLVLSRFRPPSRGGGLSGHPWPDYSAWHFFI